MNFSEFLQPAIFALTGKPGAGKSYFATRCIIAEILKGENRTIVTNVPINRSKLRAYCNKDFHLYDLATFTDNRFFFTNRGHYQLDIQNTSDNIDFGKLLKDDDGGILYIIDEAHLYFNARNWKHMQGATLSYITFIRHIGDTCIYMCQKFSDIDSQFRGKTQAFHLLRNLSKERFGWFKRGSGFRCYQYLEEDHISTHANTIDNCVQDFSYPFNLQIAECYNTSLFNKSHEKKYKVRGIEIKYIYYAGFSLVLLFCYWVYNGGITDFLSDSVPDIVTVEETNISEVTKAKLSDPISNEVQQNFLPPTDPLKVINYHEIPVLTFQQDGDQDGESFQNLSNDILEMKKQYWFGDTIKTKITFFVEQDNKDNKRSFGFDFSWYEFRTANRGNIAIEDGLYSINTPLFNGFATYVKDHAQGVSIKETEVLLKENVPFTLEHGYKLPMQNSFATQGVIKTSRSYEKVGFTLVLVFEKIDDNYLLKIDCENSDVLDISAKDPVLQTFKANNVISVQPLKTYQIADYNSQTKQQSKGFLKSNNYDTTTNNKIFLSFGNR